MSKFSAMLLDTSAADLSSDEDKDERGKDYFKDLPSPLLIRVLSFLPARTLMSASQVCGRWRRLVKIGSPSLWEHQRAYFVNRGTFSNSECCLRDLLLLLRAAPCNSFDRFEFSFGTTDPESVHKTILADRRSVRSLFVAFVLPDLKKVTSLLRKHRFTLKELQIMAYDNQDPHASETSLLQNLEHHEMEEVWHELIGMKGLKSLSVSRSLLVHLLPFDWGLETLELESWTGVLTDCLVEFNCASLRVVRVGGTYSDSNHDLSVLGKCPNLEEVEVPCVRDLSFLDKCPLLSRLCIVEGPSSGYGIASFLKGSSLSMRLKWLKLRKVDAHVFDVILSGVVPGLRSLSIKQCSNITSFQNILSGVPELEELSLTYSLFNVDEVQLLRQLEADVVPELRTLRLSGGCGYGPRGFKICLRKQCRKICDNRPNLRVFFSEECFCGLSEKLYVRDEVKHLLLSINKRLSALENGFQALACEERCLSYDSVAL